MERPVVDPPSPPPADQVEACPLCEGTGQIPDGIVSYACEQCRPVTGVAPEGMREWERVRKLLEGVGPCAKCGSDHLYWRPGIPLSCAVCMTAVPDAILAALPPASGSPQKETP